MAGKLLLQCTVYVSRISPGQRDNLRPTVRNILTQAQHLNARDNVTGLLVFNSSFFAQALEGESETIERTFGRISRDIRHSAPVILLSQSIAERSFGAWTMCARQLSRLDNDILDRFDQRGVFPSAADSGTALLGQLQAISRVHHAAFDLQTRDVHYL